MSKEESLNPSLRKQKKKPREFGEGFAKGMRANSPKIKSLGEIRRGKFQKRFSFIKIEDFTYGVILILVSLMIAVLLFFCSVFIGVGINRLFGISSKCFLWEAFLIFGILIGLIALSINYFYPDFFRRCKK